MWGRGWGEELNPRAWVGRTPAGWEAWPPPSLSPVRSWPASAGAGEGVHQARPGRLPRIRAPLHPVHDFDRAVEERNGNGSPRGATPRPFLGSADCWVPTAPGTDEASPGSNRQPLSLCRRRCRCSARRPCLEGRKGSLGANPTEDTSWRPARALTQQRPWVRHRERRRSPAGPWTSRLHPSLQTPPRRPAGAPACRTPRWDSTELSPHALPESPFPRPRCFSVSSLGR